ncbi:MAG: Lrp/AsnC ligand binding domain-containing protein [Elusimicrobiota bacterium]|jgi:DNA-binding Lrp family transcriptional regulator
MVTGLVLIRLASGREKLTMTKLKEIKGVSHLSAVFGRWDIVADIEAADLPMMTSVVVGKIRAIPGVHSTETLVTTAI